MNALTIAVDDNQPQTGGTRLVQETIKSLDSVLEVTKKAWPQDFSPMARRYKFLTGIELVSYLIRYRPKLFYFDSRMFTLVFPALVVARILKVRCVTTLQESHHLINTSQWNGIGRNICWVLLRFVCRRADMVIANSSITACLAIQKMGITAERVKVVFPGFEPPLRIAKIFRHQADKNKRNVLCVARYEWRKGVDVLLQALHHFDLPAMKVIVVGDRTPGAQGDAYYHSLEKLIPGPWVELRKKADTDTLHNLYEWAQVVVVPSRIEAFGIVVLEALWHGRTVVASDTLPDEIRSLHSSVISFKSGNSENLALKLQHALSVSEHLSHNTLEPLIDPRKWGWHRFQKEIRGIILQDVLGVPV